MYLCTSAEVPRKIDLEEIEWTNIFNSFFYEFVIAVVKNISHKIHYQAICFSDIWRNKEKRAFLKSMYITFITEFN